MKKFGGLSRARYPDYPAWLYFAIGIISLAFGIHIGSDFERNLSKEKCNEVATSR